MHIDELKSFNPGNQGEMYLPLFGLKSKNYFLINCLETSAFEELGSEFINFASNCIINTLRLIVYLTGLSI